jgi:eukaryotic-like serine/threonine-protein kinase
LRKKGGSLQVSFGPFRFDAQNGLWRDGREVPLPPRAVGVLAALVAQAGTVVSKQSLLDTGWPDTFVTESSLLEAVRLLRQALEDDRLNPTYIQTVHRRGYRFIAEVTPVATTAAPVDEPTTIFGAIEPWRPLVAASVAAVAATIGIAVVFALFGQRRPDPRPTVRFSIALPENTVIDPLRGSVAVSSDGTRMVYVASRDGQPRLFLRTIDSDTPEAIGGSEGATDPFFSPDGAWVGFFAHGSLKKVPVDGGAPVVLSAARIGAGATWSRDGTIIFGGGPGGGLARVSAQGGQPGVIAAPAAGSRELTYGWPDLLPDGRSLIFTVVSVADSSVALLDLTTGRRQTLVGSAAFGRYSPTGHLVFERRGRLEATTFLPGERPSVALSRPIVHGVATDGTSQAGPRFAFSRTGSLVYVPSENVDDDNSLHWLDTTGRLEPVPLPAAPIGGVDVAPSLRQMALSVKGEEGRDVWIGDLERGAWSRLPASGESISPTWRPDGLAIAFAYSKTGPFNLFIRPTDASGELQPLIDSPWNQVPTSWSADGRLLAFTEYHPVTGADVWLLDLRTHERRAAVRTLFDESHARFSPDGRWIAYMSNESGRWDVFARRADGSGARHQLSTSGGAWPCWSVDGRTLYFSVAGRTAAVAIQPSPELRASAPVLISSRDDLQVASGRADLGRVLVRGDDASPGHELRVVLEWFSELTRLVRRPA